MLRREGEEEEGEGGEVWGDIPIPHPGRAPLLNRSFLTTSPVSSSLVHPACLSTAYPDPTCPPCPTPSLSSPSLLTSCIPFNVSLAHYLATYLANYLHSQDQDLPVRQVEVMAGSARSRKLKLRLQVPSSQSETSY